MLVKSFQHIGKRAIQEDAYLVDMSQNLFIVCDGVGGRSKGEVASQIIIDSIQRSFKQLNKKIDAKVLEKLIIKAQKNLNDYIDIDPDINGAGTTLALLYIDHNKAFTAHVGDSRIILLKHKNNNFWATKDHSVVQELFEGGVITSEEEMQKHPLRNRITNAITCGKPPSTLKVSIHELQRIQKGDVFIICSDGVLENYTNLRLQTLFIAVDIKKAFDEIKSTSLNFCKDNNTLIMYEM